MMDDLKLQFDLLEVNTDLAKAYISSHNAEFFPFGYERSEKFILDKVNNKLYNSDREILSSSSTPDRTDENSPVTDRSVFETLAQRIEENAELFSQLETLIRKRSKEEVKNWDIQLIVQNLLYYSAQDFAYEPSNEVVCTLSMTNNSPLASLGHVVERLLEYKEVTICAAEDTGVVSHLFTKLCHEVGLTQVHLQFDDGSRNDPVRSFIDPNGCIGVITTQSDVDSAVDTLLTSSIQYPWKVKCIFLQEGIYETVKKTFKGKCILKTADPKFKMSTDAMAYRNKMILFDNAENYKTENDQGTDIIILVEAYRTTKELISFINKELPFCVSLWCSNSAEADEIAFSVNTQIVWINEFGSFWGPPDASQAFYSIKQKYRTPQEDNDVKKQLKAVETWKKLDIKSRKAIVKEVIESCTDRGDIKERVLKLIRKQWSVKETFVEIQNNRMCIGERQLGDYLLLVKSDIEVAIKYLVSGKGVIVTAANFVFKDWLEALAKKGLPIIFKSSNSLEVSFITDKRDSRKYTFFESNTKLVYKNFGTIFAN